MKPFNLEEAKAGKKVQTRKGANAFYVGVSENIKSQYKYVFTLSNAVMQVDNLGKFPRFNEHEFDLFMVEEEVTLYLNVFKEAGNFVITSFKDKTDSDIYCSKAIAVSIPFTFKI